MKAITETTMEKFEEAALQGLQAMKYAMAYKGSDRRVFEQGRIGAAATGAFVRLRASESNRMQVELMTQRLADIAAEPTKSLPRPKQS